MILSLQQIIESYCNDHESNNCTLKSCVLVQRRVKFRGSTEKLSILPQQAQASVDAHFGSMMCVRTSFSRSWFCLNLSSVSLNLIKRFLAALNLFKGPGLGGRTFLISAEDMEFHFSRGICEMQVTGAQGHLLPLSFCNCMICWIRVWGYILLELYSGNPKTPF